MVRAVRVGAAQLRGSPGELRLCLTLSELGGLSEAFGALAVARAADERHVERRLGVA